MSDFYSIQKTSDITGVTRSQIEKKISDGEIVLESNKIKQEYVEQMLYERDMYISFLEYSINHSSDRFDGAKVNNREKLLDVLEENDWFGVKKIYANQLLIGTNRDMFFLFRKDVAMLDGKLKIFFEEFGLSDNERLELIIAETKEHETTKRYISLYMHEKMFEKKMTKAFVEFVRIVLSAPDISEITDQDIKKILKTPMFDITKKTLISFFSFVRSKREVKYGIIVQQSIKQKGCSLPAYSDETYLGLARCFFNAKYIYENNMIEKALENHVYAETWLYLTIFFCCGWRAGDVCNGWKYPRLNERNMFDINTETLYEDIKEDKIPEEVYENVCKFAIGAIEMSGQLPAKTSAHNPTALVAVITPELYPFYGLLTLIAEVHMLKSGDGYMKQKRCGVYQNKMTLRSFFGDEISCVLKGKNILTRRLTKDYLQGVEEVARRQGCGGIMASAVASYARNHTNLNTLKHYLRDHNLTQENADMVLYFMLQRGVFGFEYYQTLITAYPDAFKRLSLEDQNKIIKQMDIKPLNLEQMQSEILASGDIQELFVNGSNTEVIEMLKAMFEISQERGLGKDSKVYCLVRAKNEACKHSEWESCIANCCPYLVFTKIGYIPLLKVLKRFSEAAKQGDKKMEQVLYQVLIPRYQSIINQFMKEVNMTKADKEGLKRITQEELYE